MIRINIDRSPSKEVIPVYSLRQCVLTCTAVMVMIVITAGSSLRTYAPSFLIAVHIHYVLKTSKQQREMSIITPDLGMRKSRF